MTTPLPAQGDTSWYDWATYIHGLATTAVAGDGTILTVVKITQAAYDALGTKVATTLYVIVG